MDRGTGFGRSGHSLPSGAPFPAGSANNGLSVDPGTGKIVLGNDQPGVLGTLLTNREVPLAGLNISFSNIAADSFADIRGTGSIRVHDAAFDLDTNLVKGSVNITDNIGGGAVVRLFSTIGQIDLKKVANTQVFAIDDGTAPALNLFNLDFTNGIYTLGDVNGKRAGSFLFVDDNAFGLGGSGMGYKAGADNWLTVGPEANGFTIGQQSAGTAALLTGDATNRRLRFNDSVGRYLDLTAGAVRSYRIGQISAGNGTYLNIDDLNNKYIFNNTGLGGAVVFQPTGGDLRIITPGFGARFGVFNNGASDGILLDGANNAVRSLTGATAIMIGLTAGENVLIAQDLQVSGSVNTGNPGAGAGIWKLGTVVAAASVLDATRYVQISIGGVVVKLAVIT